MTRAISKWLLIITNKSYKNLNYKSDKSVSDKLDKCIADSYVCKILKGWC